MHPCVRVLLFANMHVCLAEVADLCEMLEFLVTVLDEAQGASAADTACVPRYNTVQPFLYLCVCARARVLVRANMHACALARLERSG